MEKIHVLFLVLTLIAEVIGTIGGFGSSVFFVPIANVYFDFQTVLGLTALFHVASNLSKITQFKKGVDRVLVIYLGLPAVLFVVIGGILAKLVNTTYLELALGIFLVSLSALFLIMDRLVIRRGKSQAVIGGVFSGLFAGLLGTGGAIRGLTMAAFNLEKSAFIATSAIIDLGVDFSRTIVYFLNGFIKSDIIIYIPFLILISWVGTYLGKIILSKISQSKFKRLSLSLILMIGIFTIYSALNLS